MSKHIRRERNRAQAARSFGKLRAVIYFNKQCYGDPEGPAALHMIVEWMDTAFLGHSYNTPEKGIFSSSTPELGSHNVYLWGDNKLSRSRIATKHFETRGKMADYYISAIDSLIKWARDWEYWDICSRLDHKAWKPPGRKYHNDWRQIRFYSRGTQIFTMEELG